MISRIRDMIYDSYCKNKEVNALFLTRKDYMELEKEIYETYRMTYMTTYGFPEEIKAGFSSIILEGVHFTINIIQGETSFISYSEVL